MKKLIFTSVAAIAAAIGFLYFINSKELKKSPEKKPSEWFYQQRAFPALEINYTAYQTALNQAKELKNKHAARNRYFSWELAGPVNVGGRISAVALNPSDQQIFYVGAASGGVFKTENAGLSWQTIFDDQPSLSIGDIVLAPSNPDVIYVGTGEANAGGGSVSYDGLGVFKSDDGGDSWTSCGLEASGSIGRMAIHPQNPDICYVAAMGRMFSKNDERGVFKTSDGGQSWQKVLFLNDSTGAIDIVLDPQNPENVYAAMWERIRRPDERVYGGPSCGIWRSFDGGENWQQLSSGLPSPSANVGRIGITVAPSDPSVLYAIYADKTGYFDGVFKSTNYGDSWTQTNDAALNNIYSSYGWWFGRLRIDPTNPNIVFAIGFDLFKTSNGGSSWSNVGYSVHVDQHDLYAHPQNTNFVVLGNDGGVYTSQNGGSTWNHIENLPITQFYTSEIDQQHPDRLYGGAQDNGTIRTMTGNTNDWAEIYGGDGFVVKVDPINNQYVYAEYQYGGLGRSTNGGTSFSGATNGLGGSDRFNWMSPLTFDPVNPATLYFGSNKVYRSVNRAVSWSAISPDLTNGPGQYNQTFGTTTTISVSPVNQDIIYAGTDDGNVWVTQNAGLNWTKISDDLPDRWVTRISADPFDEATAYVTFSGYRIDEYIAHIYRTTDFGQSWTDISGDLPEAPISDIIPDPEQDSTLYVASDMGVFGTVNLGETWIPVGDNLPNVPMIDLTFQPELRMLVVATYGRSMYKINVDEFVGTAEMASEQTEMKAFPNPVRDIISIELSDNEEITQIDILNTHGQSIKTVSEQKSISVKDLQEGSYILQIQTSKGIRTKKILVNK
ncbi:MAG: T9SS type A sorting domain-containing protein [Bacteroidales bacterium]